MRASDRSVWVSLESLLYKVVCVIALLSLMGGATLAQSAGTGALTGTVTDATGAVVPNVTVTATNVDSGQARTVSTGGNGSYQITLLPPGNYRVRFEATGFQAVEIPSATVTVTETGTLNAQCRSARRRKK